jgi:heme exporter protein CcmB
LNLLSSLLIGTIIISFFGALAGALSLGKNSILASAIMLPLSLPVLILGSSASTYSSENIGFFLLLLLSLLFLTIPIISLACMGAIRLHYE